MSNTSESPLSKPEHAQHSEAGGIELVTARSATVGETLTIRRTLPVIGRRLVGAWCFFDHFGPATFAEREKGMWVGPHPHIGLQTVTWLVQGQVLHRDSIGSEQIIRPGQLNVMTSGIGIAHTEESPEPDGALHGVQLWVALPDPQRVGPPAFEHVEKVPRFEHDGVAIQLAAGSWLGHTNPASFYTELMAAELRVVDAGHSSLPLDPRFEYGLITMKNTAKVMGLELETGHMVYIPPGTDELNIDGAGDDLFFLIGGIPFGEPVLLWWNFVGRTPDEIHQARTEWEAGERFGPVAGFEGPRLTAPEWVAPKAPR
jgi:hypothetical protein